MKRKWRKKIIIQIKALRISRWHQVGESVSEEQRRQILTAVTAIPEVNKIIAMKTVHLGPTSVIVGIEADLIDELDTDKIELVTDEIEHKIMKILPESKKNMCL